MASSPQVCELREVSKRYEGVDSTAPLPILDRIDLSVAPGESVAIIGPSGSGKSTLLNIIGTLDRPTSGVVQFDGEDLSGLDEMALAAIRNQKIGFIFQAHHLLPHCSVIENVLVPSLASPDKSQRVKAEERGRKLLERVGLGSRLNHRPGQLSGGERQRVAVVRALINEPKLLLADEPTGALDQASAHELGKLLKDLNQDEAVTLIVVTHALDLARQMDRRLELRGGQLFPVT